MATSDSGSTPTEGHIGNVTYYMRNGKLIMRKRSARFSKRERSPRVLAQCSKMANLQNNWRAFGGRLKGCFELERPGSTDYSVFTSINLREARVFLSHDEARLNAAVADRLCVCAGSLPGAVQVEMKEGLMLSDLALEGLTQGVDSWMVEVARRLVDLNQGRVRMGDELVFIRLSQTRDLNSHLPLTSGLVRRLRVEQTPQTTLRQALGNIYGLDGFELREGRLAAERREGSLLCWAIQRPGPKGKRLTTTQFLVGDNPLLADYTGPEALQRAIESYGVSG